MSTDARADIPAANNARSQFHLTEAEAGHGNPAEQGLCERLDGAFS
ncbi:MAG: hypothetical protein ABWX89_04200 [Paeniglutamicibacter terrestris]